MDAIPQTTFSTDFVPEQDRYDLFKDSISVLFDIEAHDKKNLNQFEAQINAFMFDQIMLARARSNAAHYIRSHQSISSDGIDSIMVVLFIKGDIDFRYNGNHSQIRAGDIVICDLALPATNFHSDFENLTLLFPRELLESYIPTASRWHGKILPRNRPITRLLRNHMLSLYEIAQDVRTRSAASIQRSLLDLTSAAFQHSTDILPAYTESLTAPLLMEIKKYIRLNLTDAELGPDSLCSTFSLSRAQLYRITSTLGGISNYIRDLRLKRSFADLQNPALRHLSIAEIGYNWGFNDHGTYSRNFKKHFDLLPKDVRELGAGNQLVTTDDSSDQVDRNYENWVRSLSL